jgi:predicted DNA-binding protein YlxM (UPF0122 family)
MDYLILFGITYSDFISPRKLNMLNEFYQTIDERNYEEDEEMIERYKLLGRIIDGRCNKNISNYSALQIHLTGEGANSEVVENIFEGIAEEFELDEEYDYMLYDEDDIEYVSNMVAHFLNYSFVFKYKDRMSSVISKFEQDDYNSLEEIADEFKVVVNGMHEKFNEVEEITSDKYYDFDSNDNYSLTRCVEKSHKDVNHSSHKIKTGIKMKNKMLNGGYEASRVYLYLGLQGGWKSGELLNICLDAKDYNNIEFDDGRIPTVLYLTQENSIRETLERIWSHYMGNDDNFAKHTVDEVLQILNENGFCEGINIAIKYRPSGSITPTDIDAMIVEEEKKGKRIIMVVQDYLKRLRSSRRIDNSYEEQGEIEDELCNIAKKWDIPIITATQFNRGAMKIITEAFRSNKNDALKQIGTSEISESVKLVDNADYIISILQKPDSVTGNMMLSYNKLKQRGKPPADDVRYFSHPFEDGNTMRLKSDIGLVNSLSILSEGDGLEKFNPAEHRKKKAAKKRDTVKGGRINKTTTKKKSMIDIDEEESEAS